MRRPLRASGGGWLTTCETCGPDTGLVGDTWLSTCDGCKRGACIVCLARLEHGKRLYRRIALEHRGNAEAAREAGRRARSA